MFDDVPVQVWLLIAIAAVAYAPALYVYRYVTSSPRHDLLRSSHDLSWRTSRQLSFNVAILVTLLAFAVFIYTPTAARFARSPTFWPILLGGCGAWALVTVPRGLATGQIEPFVQGLRNSYERRAQPKRFWASLGWNAVFGCLCLWLAFQMREAAPVLALRDRCFDVRTAYSAQEELEACNQLIAERNRTGDDLAELIAARGSAYYRMKNYRRAMVDYSQAIDLDPRDSSSWFNRGLVDERFGDTERAVVDYTAAIRLEPKKADAYLNRGLVFLDTGEFDAAIADFTRVHQFRPKDPWPLANRGIAYAWKREEQQAEKDFAAVRAIDPSNPVLLRGEALLRMNAGDMEAAIERLTAALNQDAGDMWSLKKRSEAYRRLGDYEKSRADARELERLREGMKDAGLNGG